MVEARRHSIASLVMRGISAMIAKAELVNMLTGAEPGGLQKKCLSVMNFGKDMSVCRK